MINSLYHRLLICLFLVGSTNVYSSDAKPVVSSAKTQELKINTVYNARRNSAPFIGASLAGLTCASLPALLYTSPKGTSVELADLKLLGAYFGANLAGILAGYLCLDGRICSICGKHNIKLGELLPACLYSSIIGGVCGAGAVAITHHFYPHKLPEEMGAKEWTIVSGATGAVFGFLGGLDYMKETICTDCRNEKALERL